MSMLEPFNWDITTLPKGFKAQLTQLSNRVFELDRTLVNLDFDLSSWPTLGGRRRHLRKNVATGVVEIVLCILECGRMRVPIPAIIYQCGPHVSLAAVLSSIDDELIDSYSQSDTQRWRLIVPDIFAEYAVSGQVIIFDNDDLTMGAPTLLHPIYRENELDPSYSEIFDEELGKPDAYLHFGVLDLFVQNGSDVKLTYITNSVYGPNPPKAFYMNLTIDYLREIDNIWI